MVHMKGDILQISISTQPVLLLCNDLSLAYFTAISGKLGSSKSGIISGTCKLSMIHVNDLSWSISSLTLSRFATLDFVNEEAN